MPLKTLCSMTMDTESGYEAGPENPPFTSDMTLSDSALKPKKKKKKKPCEICGSVVNERLIMTCFRCTETREHTYCARVVLQRVPRIWLCEECRNSSSIVEIADKTAISQVEEAVVSIVAAQSSRTNQDSIDQIAPSRTKVVDNEDSIDQTAPSSRTDQVVDNKESIKVAPSSKTNQMEQVVPVVPRIHQYSTDESSLISPCSLVCPVYKPVVWERLPFRLPQCIDLSSDSQSEK